MNMNYSFLIPVKDFNVSPLVKGLITTCSKAFHEEEYEVLIAEDGSSFENSKQNGVFRHPNVHHLIRKENMGRSAARNFLADQARGKRLVFIDADSLVPEHFAANYHRAFNRFDAAVIAGGTQYDEGFAGSDQKLRLHYGLNREQVPAAERMKQPYHGFTANNFAVEKEVFNRVRFDEEIKGYGHEDTVFGIALKRKNIRVVHIDNPVIHTGLESDEVFLNKTKEGVENLWRLYQDEKIDASESKLLRAFKRSKPVIKTLLPLWPRAERSFINKVTGDQPQMQYFDLLKLLWLLRASQKPL